jgi:lysophospholipase L1-like esterase
VIRWSDPGWSFPGLLVTDQRVSVPQTWAAVDSSSMTCLIEVDTFLNPIGSGCTAAGGQPNVPIVNPTPSTIPRYVALGDSYSSGEGVPPFFDTPPAPPCHRSQKAYPELILNRQHAPSNVDFHACSGATIRDFYQNQYPTEPPQLDDLNGPAPTLVTLGVSGNDIQFRDIATACTDVTPLIMNIAGSYNKNYQKNCRNVFASRTNSLINGLTTGIFNQHDNQSYSLPVLYRDIREHAPQAKVFVVGYPNPLPTNVNGDCTANIMREDPNNTHGLLFGPYQVAFTIHKDDAAWMSKVVARLNSTIQINALDAGFSFVDNSHTMDGHDICGNQPWVHGVTLYDNSDDPPSPYSFHPNQQGQAALAEQIAKNIAGGSVTQIAPKQIIQQVVDVTKGVLKFFVRTAWPGSDVQLSLISPSGQTYDRLHRSPGLFTNSRAPLRHFLYQIPSLANGL